MSAWIVSQNHIRLLVEALYKYEVVTDAGITPETLGSCLWAENYRSVNFRYGQSDQTPHYTHDSMARATWDFPCVGEGTIRALARQPNLLAKQVACYEYQSCEHPDYKASQAAQYMAALRAHLTPATRNDSDPWGID